jgi:signal transduction histidine kinase
VRDRPRDLRVLLVEDDEEDYLLTRDLLGQLDAPPELDWVTDYAAALKASRDGNYDVCLVDYRLGAENGIDLVRELVADGETMPIIVLTGQSDRDADEEAALAGAADYLIKGEVTAALLERTIRYALANARRREAEVANLAKSEFLSRMSHELRTPLNAVLGFAQLLGFRGLGPTESTYVDQISKAGRHLLGLINEVLDLSRIETGELGLAPEPVQLRTSIEDAVSLVAPLAGERSISIRWEGGPLCDSYVEADRQRLSQVLLNLLSNAVKYNREGGTIAVTLARRAEHLRICVADSGHGMSAEQLGQLFVPFERLGAEQTSIEGSGLGLALSRNLVEAMRGQIEVESEVGLGSRFTIELPLTDPPEEDPVEHAVSAIQADGSVVGTVLCVEDNEANYQVVQGAFAHRPGLELAWAPDARTAVELSRQMAPSLILLDVHLPDGTGENLLVELRARAELRDVPVIVISADATAHQERRLRAAGANDYLTKPIDVRRLLAIVDRLMPGRAAA